MAFAHARLDPVSTIGSTKRIIELFLSGMTIQEIEEITLIPSIAINVVLRSPLVQNEIARLQNV